MKWNYFKDGKNIFDVILTILFLGYYFLRAVGNSEDMPYITAIEYDKNFLDNSPWSY